ncbi:PTX3 protein, partial [Tricholaema leucomelas]|nr:PTX3 protein [Tricholaema leucomelas]
DDYDLMYVNLDNEIEAPAQGTEETAACDCQREHTKWDKLFIMLENSQMKENMMLQATQEILKVDLQMLKAELSQLTTNLASTFATTLEKVTSHILSQVEQVLVRSNDQAGEAKRFQEAEQGKVLEHILLLSHNMSSRLGHLERCETAILFPMRSKKIFGSVHPASGMSLASFTACVWIKVTEALAKTVVFSYGTKLNPYEIQLYLSRDSAVLAVGGAQQKVAAGDVVVPGQWLHLCGSWSSPNGSAALWAQGELAAAASDLAAGHTIPEGGSLQLGQEKNGCCLGGGFDEALAFAGKLTGFNLWDRALSTEEIAAQSGEDACSSRGNVVGWGVTEVLLYGGAQYLS